jgi:predicted transcriptional regulator
LVDVPCLTVLTLVPSGMTNYDDGMTRRITISVPDHVADRLGKEDNASAYVTRAVEREMSGESVRRQLAEQGVVITDAGRHRTHRQVSEALETFDPQEQRARVERRRARARQAPAT